MAISYSGPPPVTGAWQEGDHPGQRKFVELGAIEFSNAMKINKSLIKLNLFDIKFYFTSTCIYFLFYFILFLLFKK